MLVGRPQGGSSGTQINRAFTSGESSRVVPHGHQVAVDDHGHTHTVTDPGHSHSFPVEDILGSHTHKYQNSGVITRAYDGFTSRVLTGVSVDRTTSGIEVSVK